MGAGTTDLVLCSYTPGEAPKNEILCTWPKAGEVLFGGQEVDGILKNFVRSRLPEEAAPLLKNFDNSRFKAWKENLVSPALLPQIAADPGRIIPISRPQETVALGLVYTPQSAKFSVSDEIQRQEIPADRGPVRADTSSTAEKRGEQAVKSAQGSGAGEKEPGFMDKVESALDKINWSQVGYATMRIMQILSGRG